MVQSDFLVLAAQSPRSRKDARGCQQGSLFLRIPPSSTNPLRTVRTARRRRMFAAGWREPLLDCPRRAASAGAFVSLMRLDATEPCVWLHPLTRDPVRAEMDPPDRAWNLTLLLGTVDWTFPTVHQENWRQCERLLPHGLALLRQCDACGLKSEAGERLRRKAGFYLKSRGRQNEVLALDYNPPEDDRAFF